MNNHDDIQSGHDIEQHRSSHFICAAAAEADRKVELLGNGVVNPLEKRVADLEDLNLEQRVDALFQRLRPYEDYKSLVYQQVKKLREVEHALRTRKDALETGSSAKMKDLYDLVRKLESNLEALQGEIDLMKADEDGNDKRSATLAALMPRIEELEAQHARLQSGRALRPALAHQFKLALNDLPESVDPNKTTSPSTAPRSRKSVAHNTSQLGVSKRRATTTKRRRQSKKVSTYELRNLIHQSEDSGSSSSAGSPKSLQRTPSIDQGSEKSSTSPSADKTKVSARKRKRKREVPETQLNDRGDIGTKSLSDMGVDLPAIRSERKSARTRKPRKFEDQISWSEMRLALRRSEDAVMDEG